MKKQFFILLIIIFVLIVVGFSLNDEVKAITTCGQAVSYGGQSYNTVQIGSQCWFKENLNVGTMIGNLETPDNTSPTPNNPDTVQKWCYDSSSTNCTNEGGLYSWAEANGLADSCNSTSCSVSTPNQGICPTGWHIPTDAEFYTLENYLKTPGQSCDPARTEWGCSGAGTKLVYGGSSGFDAIRAGNHETNGNLSQFDKREPSVHLWSSSPCLNCSNYGHSYNRALVYSSAPDGLVSRSWSLNVHGFSVRCLADSFTTTPSCTAWTYSDWSACSTSGQQTRTVISSSPSGCTGGSPTTTQSCTYTAPTCTSWTYSDWSSCSSDGQQTRTVTSSSPSGCAGGSPILSQSCTAAPATCTSWTYSDWSACSSKGQQTRTVASSSPSGCSGGNPILNQSCNYSKVPIITSVSPVWPGHEVIIEGNNFGGMMGDDYDPDYTRKIVINDKSYFYFQIAGATEKWYNDKIKFVVPNDIVEGYIQIQVYPRPMYSNSKLLYSSNKFYFTLTPSAPTCTINNWSCNDWSDCSYTGIKTRVCNKISNCVGGTASPATTQSCTYTPACSTDTWQCGNWGTCSPQGIQTRGCNKTYDCPSAETVAPATSQYCESAYKQNYQTPSANQDIVTNQDTIIKATVKLICPISKTMASQGSGTIINSSGLILTNKHVIEGTLGCLVGFINDYNDEPYFGDRQIADIYKTSGDADVAVLKIRNPDNITLASVNISQSNNSGIKLGQVLTTYGYPAKFGTKITYTSGDFSGVDGYYLKTTAVIEHGNSGGGAYLKNGAFIGIPTAVIKGSLNSMGYLLSVNKVNSWINGSSYAYNSGNNNSYSRVSAILDDMDLNALGSLGLFVAGDEKNVKTGAENKIDKNLSNKLKGKILLQVESHGEAWYVNPKTGSKHYMANGNEAYRIMRYLGVGITNKDLEKIKANKIFAKKNSGKIFLQVEAKGEAYYIDFNGNPHYLKDGSAAYNIMRDLGLGIKNNDLNKILAGSL